MQPLQQPRKTPRQARSRALVEAILEATARVLSERGYAGTTTNLVAERAGVSIGSVYQYFPNKDSLITALHERHAAQLYDVMASVMQAPYPNQLRDRLAAIVSAWLAVHRVEPELHRVLEKEFPFYDVPSEESPADQAIFKQFRQILERHRDEIQPTNLDLAAWVLLQTMEALIHAAVLSPWPQFPEQAVQQAIVDTLCGYLYTGGPGPGAGPRATAPPLLRLLRNYPLLLGFHRFVPGRLHRPPGWRH
ncbi:TetR/AcrR family transcriptional regulator [Pseudomonas sp. S 311-6]|nr:TetR/AcrR family transcriptional regulator [Pseudomonas sp. S 311-6]